MSVQNSEPDSHPLIGILSTVLIVVGVIGYIGAAYFFCYAAYFWIDATFIHRGPIAEDQPGGLDGLGFILEFVAGAVVAGVASVFFIPGVVLRNKIKTIKPAIRATQIQLDQVTSTNAQQS